MQWLVHAITREAGEALVRHGHTIHWPAEVGLEESPTPTALIELAEQKQWDLITTDTVAAKLPFENGQRFHRCIVYLQLAGGEIEQDDAIDRLFARYKRLTPEKLYTVTETRVKIRQLPTRR